MLNSSTRVYCSTSPLAGTVLVEAPGNSYTLYYHYSAVFARWVDSSRIRINREKNEMLLLRVIESESVLLLLLE